MRKELIRFSKYHGCGNSFVITDESKLPSSFEEEDMSRLAEEICCINTGVGADGFIVVRQEPELEMVFFNMDEAGLRCAATVYGASLITCRDNDIMTGRFIPCQDTGGNHECGGGRRRSVLRQDKYGEAGVFGRGHRFRYSRQ